MKKSWNKIQELSPKTALEKTLYAFYLKWMAWHDGRDKEQDRLFAEDGFGSDEWKKWSRVYDADHPRPKPPKALRIDFGERSLGQSLGNRIKSGYYRRPKVVVVSGEYGTSAWLIKEHSDFGVVAVDIVTKLVDTFKAYPYEHTEKPPCIEKKVFDEVPSPYGDEMAEKYKKAVQEWISREDEIAKANKINEMVERAMKGDQIAAAELVHEKMHDRDFCRSESKIQVLNFEIVGTY